MFADVTSIYHSDRAIAIPYTKFLGIYINEHLDWKPRISHVALKMEKSIGIINKVKHFITSPMHQKNVILLLGVTVYTIL